MKDPVNKLSPQSVLLFTGGAKGITAQCAVELAKLLPCTYVLMGRSRRADEPAWAQGIVDASDLKAAAAAQVKAAGGKPLPAEIEREYQRVVSIRDIDETMRQIEQAGAAAVYLSADVTDAAKVRFAIAEYERQSGRKITGLVHGAGRLADKRIERKSAADFDAVYGTKVGGLQNVMAALDVDQLQLLVLFSSVAGTFGNIGQADYAMANEALNKTAWQFQQAHPQCRVLSINWGPWDSGMVNDTLKAAFTGMGIVLISMEEGARQFVNLVVDPQPSEPQIVVGSAIQRRPDTVSPLPEAPILVRRLIEPDRNLFLLDHQIGGNRVLPATCALAWLADTCEGLFPSHRFFRASNYRVMKGLVFPDNTPMEIVLEVTASTGESNDVLICQVKATSGGERPLLHYQATIILKNRSAAWEQPLAALTGFGNGSEPLIGERYYTDKVLFHGPAFRGLQSITLTTGDSLSSVSRLPALDVRIQGQFPVGATNPYMNDVILQGLLVWTYEKDRAVSLPAGIRSLVQYAPLPFDRDCFMQAQVTHHTSSSVRADAVVTDAKGRVYLRVEGVEGTISKALLPLFQASQTSLDPARVDELPAERSTAQG
ncbi:MAG: SDR family NAD(P)-dependent oxidoreductase [Anaerolineae bacterium]|nr:SDR family NAD(P)-dependent oxidoreductase [Anaerolineae bacterium]